MTSFGIPIGNLKQFLSMDRDDRKKLEQPGIPCDSLQNELADWVLDARLSNPRVRIAIKGDGDATYPVVKKVINTLMDRKVNRFNLITGDEQIPSDLKKKPS
jgi:biopolymer transport protein ExbD